MTSSGTDILVYIAVNKISGKMYVGVTKRGLENRKKEHLVVAKNGGTALLSRAIRKYGKENFSFIAVKYFDNYSSALAKEIELIASIKPEYNQAPGGEGLRYWLGKRRSKETKLKISRTKTGVRRPPAPDYALKIWAENMRRSAKARRRPVICVETGEQFMSSREADRFYKLHPCSVASVASGRRASVYGFTFKYL